MEDLCLDRVEVLEGIQLLEAGVLQGRDREGCRSRSLVRGGCNSGRMRCWKEMATTSSASSHQSETAQTKYCGGRGSKIGMVKTGSCGSPKRTWKERTHISTAQLYYNIVPQCVGMYIIG